MSFVEFEAIIPILAPNISQHIPFKESEYITFRVFMNQYFLRTINIILNFDVLLTVHLSIILASDRLDAQILCFIISLLQSSTCFEHCGAHHQEVKLY
jgi:hypothetical protein